MSQRASGYTRVERDAYQTPGWVTAQLFPHIPARVETIWEPAAGKGQMARALAERYGVCSTDIADGQDFLISGRPNGFVDAIITNPPYVLAGEFIQHALALMCGNRGFVAMLLRTDFDHAKSRQIFFGDCPRFAKKLVLTRRIQWFEDSRASPSFNHAWFMWDWLHKGPAVIAYA